MKLVIICCSLISVLYSSPILAQKKESNALLQKDFPDLPGREGMMLIVDYAPGASSPKHRHNAHVFVYVLEGTMHMQVEGGVVQVLNPGDTFYENPDDIHVMSKNASDTEPAKAVVFFVKKEGVPVSTPVE